MDQSKCGAGAGRACAARVAAKRRSQSRGWSFTSCFQLYVRDRCGWPSKLRAMQRQGSTRLSGDPAARAGGGPKLTKWPTGAGDGRARPALPAAKCPATAAFPAGVSPSGACAQAWTPAAAASATSQTCLQPPSTTPRAPPPSESCTQGSGASPAGLDCVAARRPRRESS